MQFFSTNFVPNYVSDAGVNLFIDKQEKVVFTVGANPSLLITFFPGQKEV